MAKTKYRKKKDIKKGNELLESPEALAERLSKTEQYLEKNKKIVLIALGSLALVISAFFLGRYYLTNQNQTRHILLTQGPQHHSYLQLSICSAMIAAPTAFYTTKHIRKETEP